MSTEVVYSEETKEVREDLVEETSEDSLDEEYSRLSEIWTYPIESIASRVSLFKSMNSSQKMSLGRRQTDCSFEEDECSRESKHVEIEDGTSVQKKGGETPQATSFEKGIDGSQSVPEPIGKENGVTNREYYKCDEKDMEQFIVEFARRCGMYVHE